MLSLIVSSILGKINAVLNSEWGLIGTVFMLLVSFISPIVVPFVLLSVAIMIDLVFALAAQIKLKKFLFSFGGRLTFLKVMIYFGPLLTIYLGEYVFSSDIFLFTKSAVVLAIACEGWSILGSALILRPDMPFPKILRLQLKGEIENKMGKDISDIFKSEDKK